MSKPFILIAGLGKTGFSIARYLQRKQQPFAVFDTRESPPDLAMFKEQFPGIEVFLREVPESTLANLEAIITSPGVPNDIPLFQIAYAKGIMICGDIECFAKENKAPVIGITGTNGKSTVTTLVGDMVKEAQIQVGVAGNIGLPVLDRLAQPGKVDLWVLELSSFQLELTHSLACAGATMLNISPDHLDRHHTIEAYAGAKQRIYNRSKVAVFNRQDRLTEPDLHSGVIQAPQLVSFGIDTPEENQWGLIKDGQTIYLARGREKYCRVDDLKMKGVHNWQNALAAMALAEAVGIPKEPMLKALTQFSGLPHRTQWVKSLNGVDFINDSKGTNIGAAISAIHGIGGAMQGKIVLIAGGQGKGADFRELNPAVKEYVRAMVVLGEDAEKIMTALQGSTAIERVKDMQEAVNRSRELAQPGDVVLLSPACASLDMFNDFNHRGEVFTQLVQGLPSC